MNEFKVDGVITQVDNYEKGSRILIENTSLDYKKNEIKTKFKFYLSNFINTGFEVNDKIEVVGEFQSKQFTKKETGETFEYNELRVHQANMINNAFNGVKPLVDAGIDDDVPF